jgi:hypothetical protein
MDIFQFMRAGNPKNTFGETQSVTILVNAESEKKQKILFSKW